VRGGCGRRSLGFRFEWDESYAAERPEFRAVEAPWLTVIPGRVGRIFLRRGRLLAAYTTVRSARRALEILDGVTVRQGGTVGDKTSSEIIVTFEVSRIDAVAVILRSKRPRKRVTPNQRALQVERGRHFRFLRKEEGQTRGWQGQIQRTGVEQTFPLPDLREPSESLMTSSQRASDEPAAGTAEPSPVYRHPGPFPIRPS
jgi:hypothetical protein